MIGKAGGKAEGDEVGGRDGCKRKSASSSDGSARMRDFRSVGK